jgi:hypothetical protein
VRHNLGINFNLNKIKQMTTVIRRATPIMAALATAWKSRASDPKGSNSASLASQSNIDGPGWLLFPAELMADKAGSAGKSGGKKCRWPVAWNGVVPPGHRTRQAMLMAACPRNTVAV